MTSLTEVYGNLIRQIENHTGLNVATPGTALVLPGAIVEPPVIPEFWGDLGTGGYQATVEVFVLIGFGPENLEVLMPFVDPRSPTSIYAAVEADKTLGGLDVSATAVGAPRGLSVEEIAAYNAWGEVVAINLFVS